MKALVAQARRNDSDLVRIVEPLASFICAANQPQAALASALRMLLSEVQETNRAANDHVARGGRHCLV